MSFELARVSETSEENKTLTFLAGPIPPPVRIYQISSTKNGDNHDKISKIENNNSNVFALRF